MIYDNAGNRFAVAFCDTSVVALFESQERLVQGRPIPERLRFSLSGALLIRRAILRLGESRSISG